MILEKSLNLFEPQFLIYFFFIFLLLIVIQLQLPSFSPHYSPLPSPPPSSTFNPPPSIVFVHMSFVHVPGLLPFFFPVSSSPLPSGHCQFVISMSLFYDFYFLLYFPITICPPSIFFHLQRSARQSPHCCL